MFKANQITKSTPKAPNSKPHTNIMSNIYTHTLIIISNIRALNFWILLVMLRRVYFAAVDVIECKHVLLGKLYVLDFITASIK